MNHTNFGQVIESAYFSPFFDVLFDTQFIKLTVLEELEKGKVKNRKINLDKEVIAIKIKLFVIYR